MIALFAIAYCVVALIALIRPRWGVYCFWTATWCYPLGLLQGLLPLNVRFDDLLLVWVALCATFVGQGPWRVKSIIVPVLFLWLLSNALGNLTGWVTGYGDWASLVRTVGKAAYIPLTGYMVWRTAQTERQIEMHLRALLIGGLGAAIIGILSVRAPTLVQMWEIPAWKFEAEAWKAGQLDEGTRRAGGSLGIMYLSFTTMSLALLCTRLAIQRVRPLTRAAAMVAAGLSAVALLYTNTRGCLAGFLVGALYMFVRQKRRPAVVAIGALASVYVLLGTNLAQRVSDRLSGQLGEVAQARDERLDIWRRYLIEMPSVTYAFFGRGWLPERERVGISAHSSYVGAIAYTGLFGVGVNVLLFWRIWRAGAVLSGSGGNLLPAALGEGVRVVVIATLFAGLFVEEILAHQMRLVGAIGILAERLVHVRQLEFWWRARQSAQGAIAANLLPPHAGAPEAALQPS